MGTGYSLLRGNPFYSHDDEPVYDRGQYVQSFSSGNAIQPFFDSVDYFRTHPSSYSRVSEWLHREISVLCGLNYSWAEMSICYDTILCMHLYQEIRSSEFRNRVHRFLNDRTHHFQHEFYNFVLSGMSVQEYDRCAVYSSPSRSGPSAAGSATEGVPHSGEPPVVTISDDDESNVSEIDSDPRRGPRGTVIQCVEAIDPSNTISTQNPSTSIDLFSSYHAALGPSGIAPRMTSEQESTDTLCEAHSARARRPGISTHPDDRAQHLEEVRALHEQILIVSPGNRSRASQRQRSSATAGDSDGIPYRELYARRHDSSNTSSSSVEQSNASISSERRMVSPLPNAEGAESPPPANNVAPEDPDEIELLGVHPIFKPPPLAVITLSSDEEESAEGAQPRRLETENQAARDRPQAQALSSSELPIVMDEFLNGTMESLSRGSNVFPLSDSDEVQPIMDFRPDPPKSSTFFISGLSVAGTLSGGSFNPLRSTISNPTQTSQPRARCSGHFKTVLGSYALRLSDTDEGEDSDPVELSLDSTTDRHHKRTKETSEHEKEVEARRRAHKRTASRNKLATRSRHTHSWKEKVKRKQDSKSKKESKSGKRKRTALSSAYVSTSESDWDTEPPPAASLTPLPRSSFFSPPSEPSTSTGSPQGPSTSRQSLLDLRTAVRRQNKLSNRERRWESDDGESNDSDVPSMGLIPAPAQNSDPSRSPTGHFQPFFVTISSEDESG